MANEEFVVVAFPILENSEDRHYTHPVATLGYATLEDAKESARASNIVMQGLDNPSHTFEAMSREQFNKLEW